MSLVGSLEDLGLADILQIVSLSRKSGMLVLRSESGDGRIVLRDGLVQGAAIKGEPEDLRSLLVGRAGVDAQAFDRARGAASGGLQLDEALNRECGLAPERLAALRREHVERSVMRMFGWRTGEFSFEIREELSADDRDLLLPSGLNSQYLAMEATRLGDESSHSGGAPGPLDDLDGSDVAEPVFSGEEPSAPAEPLPAVAVDVVAIGAAQRSEPEPEPEDASAPAEVVVAGSTAGPTPVAVSVLGQTDTRAASAGYLVAVDSDLSSLEWLKASLDGVCRRVHIFQHREAALDRIRQHLMRGIVPTVVLCDVGRTSRIESAQGFIQRLRALAPAMPILALRPEHVPQGAAEGFDGVVIRPSSPSADPKRWHLYKALAQRVRDELGPWLRGEHKTSARRRVLNGLDRLKGVSERLRDPATQGEVLTLVLDYAADAFARVAMFMVRDEVAVGMAQRGLPATGGPDDAGLRAMELGPGALPELFEEVLAERTARRRPMRGDLDLRFATRLGAATPREAYAAPIESGGRVVALIYADNLPDEKPLPDTTAFEIVLHEAGLVLDRAVLERALAERG
jgi:hypothetical protein